MLASSYANQARQRPELTGQIDSLAWRKYWTDCLADSGILGLSPLGDSNYVPIDQLVEKAALKALICFQSTLRKKTPEQFLEPTALKEHVDFLSGGYALVLSGQPQIYPSCCGDLGNLSDWKMAAENESSKWMEMWIGHPTISARFREGNMEFSALHEPSEEPVGVQVTTSRAILRDAITQAESSLNAFRNRLSQMFPEFQK